MASRRVHSLHSGRSLPGDGENAVWKEAVGILLDERATNAWRAGGDAWEAVSSMQDNS